MLPEDGQEFLFVGAVFFHVGQLDGGEVALEVQIAGAVEDVGDAAGHAGAEIRACGAQYDDFPARHVFAAVVAHALGYKKRSGVPDGEAFADLAPDEDLARCGAVADDVASDEVFLGGVI